MHSFKCTVSRCFDPGIFCRVYAHSVFWKKKEADREIMHHLELSRPAQPAPARLSPGVGLVEIYQSPYKERVVICKPFDLRSPPIIAMGLIVRFLVRQQCQCQSSFQDTPTVPCNAQHSVGGCSPGTLELFRTVSVSSFMFLRICTKRYKFLCLLKPPIGTAPPFKQKTECFCFFFRALNGINGTGHDETGQNRVSC